MSDKKLLEKLKKYCEYELKNAIKYRSDVHLAFTRAYGAVMYTANFLCKDDTSIVAWWENDMWERFIKVIRGEM